MCCRGLASGGVDWFKRAQARRGGNPARERHLLTRWTTAQGILCLNFPDSMFEHWNSASEAIKGRLGIISLERGERLNPQNQGALTGGFVQGRSIATVDREGLLPLV